MQQNVNQQGFSPEGDEDFAALFEASLKETGGSGLVKEGEVIKGVVVRVTGEFAVVDIRYKSEGQVPIAEFTTPKGEITVKPGDSVDVYVESRENDTGMVVLSKEKADKMRIWDEISNAVKGDEIIKGTITGRVKGGLQVDIGVKAFLPGSQVDIRP
ncbi:MAG: S1 RNA-binding domain-containing protein, partial [Myxococcaceae bacterium]|nr:S1 RNA-binding domain-containing protein [Myxococcaceae bacterium]